MSSKKIFEVYGRCIVKRPWIVIGISLLFILISIYGMTMVYMEAGKEGIMDENTEEYKNYKKYADNFGGTVKLFVIVNAEDVIRLDILQAVDSLERNLNKSEYVTNVISISTIMKMAMLEYSGMEMLPINQTMVDMIFSSLPKDTIANLVPDEKHALVVIDVTDDIDESVDAVESALKETDFPDDVKTKVVGEPIYYNSLTEEMKDDMAITMGAAIVLMVIILWLVFGHVKLRLLPLLMVLVGVLWTLGLMGFVDIPITIIVMTVFPILVGLGIDYSINFQNRAQEELERGKPEKAVTETIKYMGPAIGIALIATCLGFGTLFISVVPMIRNFGLMCIFGVMLCYISAFSLLPAILFLYQRRKTQTTEKKETNEKKKTQIPKESKAEKVFYSVSGKTSKHPWPIFTIAIILAVGGLIAGSYLEVIVDFEDLAPEDMEAIQDLNELRDMIGGTEEYIIMVESDNITDVSLIEWISDIEELEVNKHEGITEATSIASYIKNINNNSLPQNNETLFFIINRMPERIRRGLVSDDYSLAIIKLKIQHLGNEEKEDIYNAVKKDIESHPPGIDVCVTGAPVIILKTADALMGNRDTLTIVGCILIFTG
ncbi:MAG: RND family transporter, partial [Thermoplasmatales archaeon]|nr:RND family transporter [Thermoplasmatales archaeon]